MYEIKMEEEFFINNKFYSIFDGEILCKSNIYSNKEDMITHGYEYNKIVVVNNHIVDEGYIWMDDILE